MIGIDDIVEGVLGGTSWGVGAIAIAAVAVVGAPLAKQAIKSYLAATERVREMAAEATEQIQDLYAEAKYEYDSQLAGEDAENGTAEATPEAAPRPRRRGASTTGLVTPSGEPV
jgi:hypothetical protein